MTVLVGLLLVTGLPSYLTLLTAQFGLYSAQIDLISTRPSVY